MLVLNKRVILLNALNCAFFLYLSLLLSCKSILFTAYNSVIYGKDSTIILQNKHYIVKRVKYFNSIEEIQSFCDSHTFSKQSENIFYSYTLIHEKWKE